MIYIEFEKLPTQIKDITKITNKLGFYQWGNLYQLVVDNHKEYLQLHDYEKIDEFHKNILLTKFLEERVPEPIEEINKYKRIYRKIFRLQKEIKRKTENGTKLDIFKVPEKQVISKNIDKLVLRFDNFFDFEHKARKRLEDNKSYLNYKLNLIKSTLGFQIHTTYKNLDYPSNIPEVLQKIYLGDIEYINRVYVKLNQKRNLLKFGNETVNEWTSLFVKVTTAKTHPQKYINIKWNDVDEIVDEILSLCHFVSNDFRLKKRSEYRDKLAEQCKQAIDQIEPRS